MLVMYTDSSDRVLCVCIVVRLISPDIFCLNPEAWPPHAEAKLLTPTPRERRGEESLLPGNWTRAERGRLAGRQQDDEEKGEQDLDKQETGELAQRGNRRLAGIETSGWKRASQICMTAAV